MDIDFDKLGVKSQFHSHCIRTVYFQSTLYCIHTKNLSRLKSGVEFDMNDIFYEFKYLHHF